MSARTSRTAIVVIASALLVALTSWVTAGAVGTSPSTGRSAPAATAARTLVDSITDSVTLASGSSSPHGPMPGITTVATLSNVPAGTYVVSATVDVSNASGTSADVLCRVAFASAARGVQPVWDQTVPADGNASGTFTGYTVSPGSAKIVCFDFGVTGDAAIVTDAVITLTPVAGVRATTG